MEGYITTLRLSNDIMLHNIYAIPQLRKVLAPLRCITLLGK